MRLGEKETPLVAATAMAVSAVAVQVQEEVVVVSQIPTMTT